MECCSLMSLIELVAVVIVIVQVVRLYFSDCDLTLNLKERFGAKAADKLSRKVVWITGASSGIGEYIAYEMAKSGTRLVLSARRENELERVKKQCLTSGSIKDEDVLVLSMDMLKPETHADATKKVIEHFGQIDIVVHNAGRSQRALVHETSLEVDRQMLELDFLGTVSLTKAVLPHFQERKQGHFVVNSSVAGKIGFCCSASYCSAKFALHGFFETLRMEYAEDNVAVTMLCIGPTFSGFLEKAFTGKPGEAHGVKMNPNEKRLQTDRCAELVGVAVAHKIDEAWISLNPILFFLYVNQYLPSIARSISSKLGMKMAMKIREGK